MSVQSARAIIVVATDANPDVSDARVLRTVLALMGEHDKLRKRGHLGLKARGLQALVPVFGWRRRDETWTIPTFECFANAVTAKVGC